MAKDPAALLYIDLWLTSTAEMDADVRGWYLNLVLHQYDKKDLPNDMEKLAMLANVKFSEYERFKQVFEQVFKHKFALNSNNRLENEFASQIIRKREQFIDKRSSAGKLSYVLKYFRNKLKMDSELELFIKENMIIDFDIKNEQVLEHVFKHMSELYINKDGDRIKSEYELCVEIWLKEIHEDFTFGSVQGKNMKSIIKKISGLLVKKKKEVSPQSVADSFRFMCVNFPDWYKDKDLAIIDSKFNEIIEQIKKPKKDEPTDKITRTIATRDKVIANLTGTVPVDQGTIQS